MKKAIFVLGLILALSAFVLPKSYASVAVASAASIHTTVLNPQTNTYVDSLGLTDSMYNPGDTVVFHITISNDGSSTIPLANVDNTFPDYVSFVSGAGNLNSSKKVLSFTVSNIGPKTTRSYAVLAKIADADNLPTNQGVVCVADKAELKTPDREVNQSSSSFCIQKAVNSTPSQKVFPAVTTLTKTPPTGPEAISFLSIFSTGLAGIVIRKITRKQG